MSISIIGKKLVRNLRDYGPGITLGKMAKGAVSLFYEKKIYRIYRIKLDSYVPVAIDNGGFTVKLLDPHDTSSIKQIEETEEWLSGLIRKKLRAGSICLVAKDGDRMAGFNLVSFGNVELPIVKTRRMFRPNEAWSEQITVSSEYRGRGLATILRRSAFSILKELGIRKFYGGTLPLNVANRNLSKKVGFKEIADIIYCKSLNNKTWTCTRVGEDA